MKLSRFVPVAAVLSLFLQGCAALQNHVGDADTFGMIALVGFGLAFAAIKWSKDMSMVVLGGVKLIRFVFSAGLILLIIG